MTNRELSEKLCSLGCQLEELAKDDPVLLSMAKELHAISNENYSPGSSWGEIQKQVKQAAKKKVYRDSSNREMPF